MEFYSPLVQWVGKTSSENTSQQNDQNFKNPGKYTIKSKSFKPYCGLNRFDTCKKPEPKIQGCGAETI
jgi:hypothetical protein